MFKLPVRTWILNAAAVLSGQHGGVTRQAQDAACRRETVDEHAHTVEQRLTPEPGRDAMRAEVRAENQHLRQQINDLQCQAEDRIRCDKAKQRQFAITTFAMGLSLRPIEQCLGLLLPATKAPDHSTVGHWVQTGAERAQEVLAVLDTACAPQVRTVCLDEIFFGGDRLWSGSSRRA